MNVVLPFIERPGINGAIDLGRYMDLIQTEHKGVQITITTGTKYNSVPSRNLYIKIDPDVVGQLADLPSGYQQYIP